MLERPRKTALLLLILVIVCQADVSLAACDPERGTGREINPVQIAEPGRR